MSDNPLGGHTSYPKKYAPEVLYPIPRWPARSLLDIDKKIRMYGIDHWRAYELSWLDTTGKPQVAAAEFFFNSESENLVESKSFKLYLNSINNEQFPDSEAVAEALQKDLSALSKSEIKVVIRCLEAAGDEVDFTRRGINLDVLDLQTRRDMPDESILQTGEGEAEDEIVYSDLFKSNCPVTGQPDWASVEVRYSGRQIDHASLLSYLISFRNHQAYHEECAERVFRDITNRCEPTELWVGMNYLRRGGLDINVYRSTVPLTSDMVSARLVRQ